MLDAAFFVSSTIHEREITLEDGSKHALHFREIPAGELQKMQAARDDQVESATSRVIAASLCKPDGTPAITVDEARKLKHGVRLALAVAIAQVNGLGASVGKTSPPEASSGSGTS